MPLPALDAESAAHSLRVTDYIRRCVAEAGGCISFAEYMYHALYAPGLGYYSAGARKFGEAGDFVTAPEISPIFAGVLARQCAELFSVLDAPSMLEIGAGSGRLVCDLLKRLAELGELPERYEILEVSPDLRDRQSALVQSEVPDLAGRVSWVQQFPESLTGVIVANEVLDALPVERFAIRADGISQLCVTCEDESFAISERAAPRWLVGAIRTIEQDLGESLPEGFVSDVCVALPAWIADMAGTLERGAAFLFDYGIGRREYYAKDRSGGWVRCHFRHHAHNNALQLPGIQDITAWVDFSAVAAAAVENGLDIQGYVTQAQFLIGGGLDDELAGFEDLPIDAQLKLSGQVKLLTLPGEMGENFKCIGLSRGPVPRPTAFTLADRTMSL